MLLSEARLTVVVGVVWDLILMQCPGYKAHQAAHSGPGCGLHQPVTL